ncbi:MAG TPA: hypothetical protein VFL57_03600 [Bryobacteraceae bacterium]|nr:hypothetical protein [Bryobacteraceae bacterium]
MEERARLIGGEFRVRSALREGTTVEVEVPLEAASEDGDAKDHSSGHRG